MSSCSSVVNGYVNALGLLEDLIRARFFVSGQSSPQVYQVFPKEAIARSKEAIARSAGQVVTGSTKANVLPAPTSLSTHI